MRLLGVDYGLRRIGVAVGDKEFAIVSPRPPIAATGRHGPDAVAIAGLARREECERVVVGLPLEHGEEGNMARVCRRVGEKLRKMGLDVDYFDESLTSVEAEARLLAEPLTAAGRRKRRDAEAAAILLERYIHEAAPH